MDSLCACRLSVNIRDLEIIDNVQTSMWRKFLSPQRPDAGNIPRETSSSMVRIEMTSVRPNLNLPLLEELRLKVCV
jgi:hypothetical protein